MVHLGEGRYHKLHTVLHQAQLNVPGQGEEGETHSARCTGVGRRSRQGNDGDSQVSQAY